MEIQLIPLIAGDSDLSDLEEMHREPSIARFLSLSPGYFSCILENEDAVYYKIKSASRLLGGIHCELCGNTIYLSICVGEAYRRKGIAFGALRALIGGLPKSIKCIEAGVEAENLPSLRLFEKLGFRRCGWAEGLLTYRLLL